MNPKWLEPRVYRNNETPITCLNCEYKPDLKAGCLACDWRYCAKGHTVKLKDIPRTVDCEDFEAREK